jgi:hypothetical protein
MDDGGVGRGKHGSRTSDFVAVRVAVIRLADAQGSVALDDSV